MIGSLHQLLCPHRKSPRCEFNNGYRAPKANENRRSFSGNAGYSMKEKSDRRVHSPIASPVHGRRSLSGNPPFNANKSDMTQSLMRLSLNDIA